METTINNPAHFELHKTLTADNWRALRRTGEQINDRFLARARGRITPAYPMPPPSRPSSYRPSTTANAAPGLRFGEPRVMALLASIASFEHVTRGLTNRALREHMADLFDPDYNSRQATYDLRRLRLKGLIELVEGTHTYRCHRPRTGYRHLLHPPGSPGCRARPHRPRRRFTTIPGGPPCPCHRVARLRRRTPRKLTKHFAAAA